MEEATTALAEARRLYPNLTIKREIAGAPRPTNPHYVEGLRKAAAGRMRDSAVFAFAAV